MKILVLFQLAIFLTIVALGTYCVNYDLFFLLHKTVPTFWALVLNVVTGGQSITLAIILKILSLLGVLHG